MEVLEALSQMLWNSLVFAKTLFVRFKAAQVGVSLLFISVTTSVANLSVV
jgi:hypothetical protein